ncbi:MAG: hypothetical protein ACRC7O_09445 [Fimbriiglobus sp.]
MSHTAKYVLRYFFECGGCGCLWADNDPAHTEFNCGPLELSGRLPLTSDVPERCAKLAEWYDTSMNRDYPPDPGPRRQSECDAFNAAARELLLAIRAELGTDFDVIDGQPAVVEDPDLGAYLADPKGFRRRS